ncbi:hypothetical protein RQP46_002672 [Phenoliferia psychrophenolica]
MAVSTMTSLPQELLIMILRHASRPARGSPVNPDSEEARLQSNRVLSSLALVSQSFRAVAEELLYGRPICVTVDSANAFLETISHRPELQRLVLELSGPWLTEAEAAVMQRAERIRTVRLVGMIENGLLECLPSSAEILTLAWAQPMAEVSPFDQLDSPLPYLPPLPELRMLTISGTLGPTWTHIISHTSLTITSLHLLHLHIREPHVPLFLKTFADLAPHLRSLILTPFDAHDALPPLPFNLLTSLRTLGLSSNALLLPPANLPVPLALLPATGSLTTLVALNSLHLRGRSQKRRWHLAEELVQQVRFWPVCRNVKLVVVGDRALRDEVKPGMEAGGIRVRMGKYAWSEGVVEYE